MPETYMFSIYRSTSAVIHSKRSEDIPTFSGFAEGRFLVSLAETRPVDKNSANSPPRMNFFAITDNFASPT